MKHLLLIMMLLLPWSAQAADRELVDLLYEKSGLQQQNELIAPSIVDGLVQERSTIPDEEFELLKSSALEAFNPELFEAVVKQRFMAELSNEQVEAVLSWLDSPVGKRLTRAEEESSTIESQQQMPAYVESLRQSPPPESRLQLIKRFDQAVGGTKFAGELVFNIQMAIISGLMAIAPEAKQQQLAAIKGQLFAGKEQMVAAMQQQSLLSMLYTYRSVGDGDIERYILFANTPAGKAYHHESLQAFVAAFEACSKKMGVLIGLKQRGDSMDI